MALLRIHCPRCREILSFRAEDGDERECAECGLEFVVADGQALYDIDDAALRPVRYVCPSCEAELSVYAYDGEHIECPDCAFGVEIENGKAMYDPKDVEERERALLAELEPKSEDEAMGAARAALRKLRDEDDLGPLSKFVGAIQLFAKMVYDAVMGEADIPWATILSIAGALAYFVLPADVVPDWLPVVGYIDDMNVVGWVIEWTMDDIRAYARSRRIRLSDYGLA